MHTPRSLDTTVKGLFDENRESDTAGTTGPTLILVVLLSLPIAITLLPTLQAQSSCVARTGNGDIQGVSQAAGCAYLAVPYAAAPVGNLRWRPPQPPVPWTPAVLNATAAPPTCPQINPAGAMVGNEDCLRLNIWVPSGSPSGSGYPVLVWLHPGAFVSASANFAASDGRRFAQERGAVVVAANYRLGALGFLAHRALTAEDPGYPTSGNYGLADQRAALRWVRDHIAAFGGDPTTVALAGTSAGAASTSAHLVSPASRGLFHRAIMQSGQATARTPSLPQAEIQGDAFAASLGCSVASGLLACLRARTRDEVLAALPVAGLTGGFQTFLEQPGRVVWGPVVDGVELPDQPRELYRRGLFARVPIIIGTNRDDGWTFVDRSFPTGLDAVQYDQVVRTEFGMDASAILSSYPTASYPTPKDALARLATDVEFVCEARRIARVMHHDGAPVFLYSFEYPVEQVTPGRAFHGLESNLLFGNNFGAPSNHVLTSPDLAIFDMMSGYWRQFIERGDPSPPGASQWRPYRPVRVDASVPVITDDWHVVFEPRSRLGNYLRDAPCNFWEPFFFRSVTGAVPASAR